VWLPVCQGVRGDLGSSLSIRCRQRGAGELHVGAGMPAPSEMLAGRPGRTDDWISLRHDIAVMTSRPPRPASERRQRRAPDCRWGAPNPVKVVVVVSRYRHHRAVHDSWQARTTSPPSRCRGFRLPRSACATVRAMPQARCDSRQGRSPRIEDSGRSASCTTSRQALVAMPCTNSAKRVPHQAALRNSPRGKASTPEARDNSRARTS